MLHTVEQAIEQHMGRNISSFEQSDYPNVEIALSLLKMFNDTETSSGFMKTVGQTDSSGNARDALISDADATFGGHYSGVANAGDQNQDGYDELMVGGESNGKSIYLFYGAPN